jgi:hypothetical protein
MRFLKKPRSKLEIPHSLSADEAGIAPRAKAAFAMLGGCAIT